ncbi:MAG: hypothetical protein ACOWWO_11780 [Peptococcaceae bacterium]
MDRFNRGLIAGVLASIPMNIWDLFAYHILNYSNLRYLDWGCIMLFGHLPTNLVQSLLGFASQLMWVGFLGVIFSFLTPFITSKTYLIKGAFFGFITGFIIYAIPVVFGTKYLSTSSTGTTVTQIFGGLIWGISLAKILTILNQKILLKVK